MSTKNSFTSCPSFNLKAFERELLYEIWPHEGSFMICLGAYNPINSSSNSSWVKLHLDFAIGQYDCFRNDFFRWNQSVPPSAPHMCMKLEIDCWMYGHWCRSALDELQQWKLYLVTLRCYLLLFRPCIDPNPSPVACFLPFPSSSPPEPPLHISSKTSPPMSAESIQHYPNFPKAARSQTTPKNLQPPTPGAGVHFASVSNGSVPGWWTDPYSRETQPPILSSICWTYWSWADPSFWQIASGC